MNEPIEITDLDREMAKKVFEANFGNKKSDKDIFYELCFCICAPQTTFKNNIQVINKLRELDFYGYEDEIKLESLWKIVKPVRFYKRKTQYLLEAKDKFQEILRVIKCHIDLNHNIREAVRLSLLRYWLVKNVKGLGLKVASHFLRNLGVDNLAIVDTHILKFLNVKDKKWDYFKLEDVLRQQANMLAMSVAELDIIVWKHYSKTDWKDYVY
jgi:N-glycosylase/DNA lyase